MEAIILTTIATQVLNELQQCSPDACSELLAYRVKTAAGHSTIQVQGKGENTKVGLLGVINGILVAAGQNRVAMIRGEQEECLGFVPYPESKPTTP